MSEEHLSKCPYPDCGHENWRTVSRVQCSYNGNHTCKACGRTYSEWYKVQVTIETFAHHSGWAAKMESERNE